MSWCACSCLFTIALRSNSAPANSFFSTATQVLHRMAERPDEDFTALQFTGSLEDYVRTLDAAASLAEEGAATAMDECDDGSGPAKSTPATAKEQKKKAAAAKSKPAAAVGIQKGGRALECF
jgi:hypothetical protein